MQILQFFRNCYYICVFPNCTINSRPNYCVHGGQTQTGLLTHSNFTDLLRVGTKGNNFSGRRMSGCALLPVVLRPLILTELRLSSWDPANVRGASSVPVAQKVAPDLSRGVRSLLLLSYL